MTAERRAPGGPSAHDMNNEAELRRVLEHWLPDGTDLEAHLDAYNRDYWTLRSYITRIYSVNGYEILDAEGTPETVTVSYRADVLEVLTFPALTGLSPTDPEMLQWVLFLCHHRTAGFHDSKPVHFGRFGHPADAYRRLRLAGVPFEYLEALDCGPAREPLYPLDAVIEAWNAGIPIEYARETIYGVSA